MKDKIKSKIFVQNLQIMIKFNNNMIYSAIKQKIYNQKQYNYIS